MLALERHWGSKRKSLVYVWPLLEIHGVASASEGDGVKLQRSCVHRQRYFIRLAECIQVIHLFVCMYVCYIYMYIQPWLHIPKKCVTYMHRLAPKEFVTLASDI